MAIFCYFYFVFNVSPYSQIYSVLRELHGVFGINRLCHTGVAAGFQRDEKESLLKRCSNTLPDIAQMFMAITRKWNVILAREGDLHELEGSEAAIEGCRKTLHTNEFM